jgi:mono/diheme cytochrome c family protein
MKRYSSLLCLLAAAVLLHGQTKIRQTPIQPTSAASGEEMYMNYCASCHGKDGKGNGPAAPALKRQPSDLTMLSKKNGGKFPGNAVYVAISGQFTVSAHGSREMPVWGQVFGQNDPSGQAKLRLTNLTNYIQSLQAK